MDSDPAIWREQLTVHSYDVDFRKRASPQAICRWFLEAAWNHAERLGIGFTQLGNQNQFWVLSRLFVQIHSYPAWGQTVVLSTSPKGIDRAFALRQFVLHDSSGVPLSTGSSSWLVLNATTRRPQRIDKLLANLPTRPEGITNTRDPLKLASAQTGTSLLNTTVGYSDIDVNFHVNSASYVNWCLNSYPPEFHQRHVLLSLELNYLGETTWHDRISIASVQTAPSRFTHSIFNGSQEEVCRGEFIWAVVEP